MLSYRIEINFCNHSFYYVLAAYVVSPADSHHDVARVVLKNKLIGRLYVVCMYIYIGFRSILT